MPITLNHSNINVQYSSDKSYIIETVKSDLYRRNEIVDTIIRNNIQTAPVTPTTYVDSSGNVYAVESYTYSGTANTADYTRVFTNNTTCDILIVGGGGGGGSGIAGGGGGGQVVHATNINIPIGTYNIIVGSGGAGGVSNNGTNGANSVAFGATANGGGGGGGTGTWGASAATGLSGGSGGGGGANNTNTVQSAGTVSFGSLGTILASAIRYGNAGGTGKYDISYGGGGGGGGAGSVGTAGNSTSKGNGGNGIIINITGTSYYWGGGGGGGGWASSSGAGGGNGGLGGGGGGAFGAGADTSGINGLGGINNNSIQPLNTIGGDGANNTGGGGGGGTYNAYAGGKGGSGIVIIRYLLGSIATTNFLTNEPFITTDISPIVNPIIYTFKHKRGTNNQELYTITFDIDTLCDILIVGGGGSSGAGTGASNEPGGGGGGGIVYMINKTLKGTYNIYVGNGGANSNGYDSEIRDSNNAIINFDGINLIGKGGGKGGTGGSGDVGSNGGSGGGGSHTRAGGTATQGNTFWDGTQYVQGGFNGSVGNPSGFTGNNGGGGGGANATALGCEGGHGRLIHITGYSQYYGGGGGASGGAGGRAGGLGGGGSGRIGGVGGDGVKGTNDLGGGGGAPYSGSLASQPGGTGIVIIRAYQNIINKNIITFRHSENINELQTEYQHTFYKDTICDILVVGGGGGGGGAGGSGGGGGVIEYKDVNIKAGKYKILVGYGGFSSTDNGINGNNGNNSSIEGNDIIIRAAGGGGGGQYNSNSTPTPPTVTSINPLTKLTVTSQGGGGGVRFNSIPYTIDTALSGSGGINTDNNGETGGAGGGSAPASSGGTGGNSYRSTGSTAYLGNGGRGIISTITGMPIEYGSGGAGGRWNSGFDNTFFGISTGGGGYAEIKDINNKNYFYIYYKGMAGTGGGGYANTYGGSGVVIIKIKSVIEKIYYKPFVKDLNYLINSASYPYISADTTNLIAWYKFDGNSNDSNPTTTKHNFTTLSGTISYGKDSIINKPYLNLFNGTLTNSTLKFNNRAFTISYLFRLYTYDALAYIYTTDAQTTNNAFHIGSRGTGAYFLGFFGNDIETNRNYPEDVNNWVLFTATVETNNNRKMYRNGVLFKSDFNTSTLTATGNLELRINRVDICDMRVYNKALSQNEITELYNGYMRNTFTINFPDTTISNINNGGDKLLKGLYTITVGTNESKLLPLQNQNLKDANYSTSALIINYNTLNPILDPIGAQWTYNSSNTNVYHMGNVGIGTKSPEYQLDVRGFIHTSVGGYTQTGSENWIIQSDRRIKENIVKASYEKCLENVKNIELYNFNFKDNCVNTNDRHQLGFIAQEVQQVYPKAVEVGKIILDNNQGINDLLTLNTTQIKYTLYGAVKNLIERVENIESRVEQIYNMTLSSNFKSPSSNISISIINTSNMTANTSNIATNTSNINTSNVATNTSNIAVSTSNVAVSTSNIAVSTSNIAVSTSNIAVSTSNIAVSTSNIAVSTSNIAVSTSNIATNTSNIAVSTSNVSVNTSNIAVSTSNISVSTSNINTSNIDTSNIDTSNV